MSVPKCLFFQDLEGLTETATTAETAKTVKTVTAASWYCIFQEKQKEGKVLSKTVKTAKTVMKATPLKLNPLFREPDKNSEDFSLLVTLLLVTFSWLFRGFFVAFSWPSST